MKTITINGVNFEVKTPRKNKVYFNQCVNYLMRYQGRDIWDCYDRPSEVKQEIYKDWVKWYTDCDKNVDLFGITSYNCMQFSLGCLYYDRENNVRYSLSITRDHNVATVITMD